MTEFIVRSYIQWYDPRMKAAIGLLFCCYIVFFCLLPPFQTPDEQGHYETAFWLSRGVIPFINEDFQKQQFPFGYALAGLFNFGNEDDMIIVNAEYVHQNPVHMLPYSQNEVKKSLPVSGQAYNPPFYYAVTGVFLRIAESFSVSALHHFYAGRMVNGLFYGMFLYFFYLVTKALGLQNNVRNNVILIVGLNPLVLQTGIGYGPDMAFSCCVMIFLWFFIRWYKRTLDGKKIIILSLSLAICGLTKITGITVILPVFMIAYLFLLLHATYTNMNKSRYSIRSFLLILCLVLCFVSPWFLLNTIRYGKPVVESVALGIAGQEREGLPFAEAVFHTIAGYRHTFMHFSGFLGWNDVHPFPFIFWPYTVIFVVCMFVGLIKNSFEKYIHLFLSVLFVFSFFFFSALALFRLAHFHPGWGIGGRNILYLYPFFVLYAVSGIKSLTRFSYAHISAILAYSSLFYYYTMIVLVLLPRYYV